MARQDANKAASTLKEALGGPGVEWAALCCVMRLLKLVIKAQAAAAAAAPSVDGSETGRTDSSVAGSPAHAESSGGGTPRSAGQQRAALRSQLAGCFADVWFPAISLQVRVCGRPHHQERRLRPKP